MSLVKAGKQGKVAKDSKIKDYFPLMNDPPSKAGPSNDLKKFDIRTVS